MSVCVCAVRVEKVEHCSAAGQCDQALVISPEGCGQVKASKRGWEGDGDEEGGVDGYSMAGREGKGKEAAGECV